MLSVPPTPIACPGCEGTRLRVLIRFLGEVSCEFCGPLPVRVTQPAEFDAVWDETAACRCTSCGWSGTLGDASRLAVGSRLDGAGGPCVLVKSPDGWAQF